MAAATPAQQRPVSTGATQSVQIRNEFYRDGYKKVLTVSVALAAALVGSIGANIYLVTNPTQNKYFATTPDGKVLPISPLDEPSLDQAAVLSWAARAAVKPYNFDFLNYRAQLQAIAVDFTTSGYNDLLKAYGDRNIIDYVTKKQLLVASQPSSAAVITAQGQDKGIYTWRVQVPINVTFQGGPDRINSTQNLMVSMVVMRVPNRDNPDGLGVNQYIVSSR